MGYMWATCGKPVDKNNVVWKTCGQQKESIEPYRLYTCGNGRDFHRHFPHAEAELKHHSI